MSSRQRKFLFFFVAFVSLDFVEETDDPVAVVAAILERRLRTHMRTFDVFVPPRRDSPHECVYMANFQPSQARSLMVNSGIPPRKAGPLAMLKHVFFL